MFPGIRSSLISQALELSLLPLAFSPSLTVASLLLHPYGTDDKTSSLMVKQFSTMRYTQRDSQLHIEEKRQEGDRGDQKEKRESQKGREQSRQVISSLNVLHCLEHPGGFTELSGEEKREEGDIGDLCEKRENQKERI